MNLKISSLYPFMFILVAMISPRFVKAQIVHTEICGLEVVEAVTQEIAGRNIGFVVKIRNNNEKTFDALEYKVIYTDGFGEKVGEKDFKWQSGNIIGPVKKGETLDDVHANWVKGANRIRIVMLRVHFTDDTICKK